MKGLDYALGLDLGTTSIGWAVVQLDKNNEPEKLIDAGVRIFPAPVEDKTGTPLSAQRRKARSMRRMHQRRNARRKKLLKLLQGAGMLPKQEQLTADWPTTLNGIGNAYTLRALALRRELKPIEIGRALYHLAQRRGFKSNRKDSGAKDDDAAKSTTPKKSRKKTETDEIEDEGEDNNRQAKQDRKEQINNLRAWIGEETLGSRLYLHHRQNPAHSLRFKTDPDKNINFGGKPGHPDRDMYVQEFRRIWDSQQKFHPNILTDSLKKNVEETIFFQRPFDIRERWGENLEALRKISGRANALRSPQLGKCSLLPKEKRCAADVWTAQHFRIRKEVNNLRRITSGGGSFDIPIETKRILWATLDEAKEMTMGKLKELAGLQKKETFNLERGQRNKLKGNSVEAAILKTLAKESWTTWDHAKKSGLRSLLTDVEDTGKFVEAAKQLGLDDAQAGALADFDLNADHYVSYSARAMEILIPYLEQGLNEYDAIEAARKDGRLPQPEVEKEAPFLRLPPQDIPNPVVKRALHETRKVINALIREYGKPRHIRIELARDAYATKKQKARMSKNRNDREQVNKEGRTFLLQNAWSARKENLLRYRLWKEQGCRCPYSGRTICKADFLNENVTEIDHILPYSVTQDDSAMNKVLCFATENRRKWDRTPYQWKHSPEEQPAGPEEYGRMLQVVNSMQDMPEPKRVRFSLEKIDDRSWQTRDLNDTRYISREVSQWLQVLYPPDQRVGQKAVRTMTGSTTSILRSLWGLNKVLNPEDFKNRLDHRHHAIDAIVIACTTDTMRKHLSDAAQREERGLTAKWDLEPPWGTKESFWKDVNHIVKERERNWVLRGKLMPDGTREPGRTVMTKGIVVSHRVWRKLSGPLHKADNWGWAGDGDKPAPGLIKDKAKYLIAGSDGPEPKSYMIASTRRKSGEAAYRFNAAQNNHHVQVIVKQKARGKGTELDGEYFTAYEVARHLRREESRHKGLAEQRLRKPVLNPRRDGFLFSLATNESVFFDTPNGPQLFVMQSMSPPNNKTIFMLHVANSFKKPADLDDKDALKEAKRTYEEWALLSKNIGSAMLKTNPVKVTVDPIGRIFPAHD